MAEPNHKLLTAKQVCELLNRGIEKGAPKCNVRVLSQWRLAGCPFERTNRGAILYPAQALADWLVVNAKVVSKKGEAKADEDDLGVVLNTRREVADFFGVHVRTVAYWLEDKSFPGQPPGQGKRNGYFPVKPIGRWLILNRKQAAIPPDLFPDGAAVPVVHEPMVQAQHRLLDTRGSILELEYHRRRGELIEVDTAKRWFERVNSGARAIFNGLKPAILQRLPDNLDKELVTSIVVAVDNCVSDVCDAMAELLEGDQDEIETKRV